MHLEVLQEWFVDQIFNSAERGFSIYAQQYWQRLLPILRKDYPTLLRLFGPDDFDRLIAKPYVIDYPPNHWSLRLLGSRLPQWIEAHYREEDKILVHQASLVDESFIRIRSNASPPTDLSAPIYLQSYVALLALDADLFAFRREMLKKESWIDDPFPTINWDQKHYFACSEEITQTQYILLKAFEKGATLEEACSHIDAGSDIANWFQSWIEKKWLCHC